MSRSSVLPFEIIDQIIDNIEDEDAILLKELALVSHSFLQICNKHLFATVDLHDAVPRDHVASSKKGFVKLLKNRPDTVKYIRKLTYKVTLEYDFESESDWNLPVPPPPSLPNLLRTIPNLNCLTIDGAMSDWKTLESPLTSAFIYLMHLPTINHIDLSCIENFPLSILTACVNLHRLDIFRLEALNEHVEDDSFKIVVQPEMVPKIRELRTVSNSYYESLTTDLLLAKRQDGRPAFFNFTNLRRLSISYNIFEDIRNIQYFLQNARLLEKLDLSIGTGRNFMGLLSPGARTLKVLDLALLLDDNCVSLPLSGLCEELEAMAGHDNMLEALSLEFHVDGFERKHFIGSILQDVDKVLAKPGWSALRQVSFKISIQCCMVFGEKIARLSKALQSLPDNYLNHLPELESIAFSFSVCVVDKRPVCMEIN